MQLTPGPSGGNCTACATGTFKVPADLSLAPFVVGIQTICGDMTYFSSTALLACQACPTRSTAKHRASKIMDYICNFAYFRDSNTSCTP